MKPIALDLFCGGGGVAQGLMEAGFEVIGLDINGNHRKNYPGKFTRMDIKTFASGDITYDLRLVWASPPCQLFSCARRGKFKRRAENLIPFTRELLKKFSSCRKRSKHTLFTCIENVEGAPIRKDLILTGQMFGLKRIYRKRVFELSHLIPNPTIVHGFDCEPHEKITVSKHMGAKEMWRCRKKAGLPPRPSKQETLDAMGIKHNMTWFELGESIPPAYSRYIGKHAMRIIKQGEENE